MANKVEYGRRSSQDPKWQAAKEAVDKRDRNTCRFLRCLTAVEYHKLRKESETHLDHAHVFSAGNDPANVYNPNNIVLLSRFVHRRMDNYKDPLTGDSISNLNYHYYWWYRIVKKSTEQFNNSKDYEELLREIIPTATSTDQDFSCSSE